MSKKANKVVTIVLIIIGILLVVSCAIFAILLGDIRLIVFVPLIFLMMLSEHHTIYVNNTFQYVENPAIKEIVQNEFGVEDNTYIRKITYTEGFDDGQVYNICVYYKKNKECKKSDSPLGPASDYDYDEK